MDKAINSLDLQTDFSVEAARSSTSKVAEFGKLRNSLSNSVRWLWIFTGVSFVVGMAGLLVLTLLGGPVTGPEARTSSIIVMMTAIIFLTFALIGLISAPLAKVFGKSYRRQLERIEAGEYQACWIYSDSQWKEFIDDEHAESDSIVSTTVFVAGVLAAVISFSFAALIGIQMAVLLLIGLVSAAYPLGCLLRHLRKNKLSRWSETPWFAIIGYEGLYYAEKYLPFSMFGSGLDSVEVASKDAMTYLVFTFYSQTQDGRSYTDHRIPVPFGKEQEARAIVGD